MGPGGVGSHPGRMCRETREEGLRHNTELQSFRKISGEEKYEEAQRQLGETKKGKSFGKEEVSAVLARSSRVTRTEKNPLDLPVRRRADAGG